MIVKVDIDRLIEILKLGKFNIDQYDNALVSVSDFMKALEMSKVSDDKNE